MAHITIRSLLSMIQNLGDEEENGGKNFNHLLFDRNL